MSMRKFFLIAALLLAVSMNSTNTITLGDSIRIHPVHLGGYSQHTVSMRIDGMCDSWTMGVAYPEGLSPKLVAGTTPLEGMTVSYHNKTGAKSAFTANLEVSYQYQNIAASITVPGYWDYNQDGEWESYGTVKWMPGDYNLFEYNFYVNPSFRSGYVYFDGIITSGSDQRGAVLMGVRFFSKCWFWVGYQYGDITGNERINIDDVTALISYLVGGESLDEFALAAADANRDGNVTIADVTYIINKLLW